MKLHQVRVYKSEETLERKDQLAWKIAEVAAQAGIEKVVFDRNGYLYHGRIKSLADSAREGGLKF